MTVLRKLRHANIVSYRGMEYEDHRLSLFMELCPGGSISTVLGSFGCLSTSIVRRYTYQILSGRRPPPHTPRQTQAHGSGGLARAAAERTLTPRATSIPGPLILLFLRRILS